MTDQPPSQQPTGQEPTGDVPAALRPDDVAEVDTVHVPEPTAAEPTLPAVPAVAEPAEPAAPAAVPEPLPPAVTAPEWTPDSDQSSEPQASGPAAIAAQRPEIAVGAAFAGGLVLALTLKRLAR